MSEAGRIIGMGRSGVVITTENPHIVEKRFQSTGLEKVIQTLFFGGPNYDTDEDAVNATNYKRLVLSDLFELWFEDKLRVAKPKYVRYNEEEASFTLGMEFIKGRAPKVLSPFQQDRSELTDLIKTINILQSHLDESGFIGTLWQAGKGNPVALNNFLLKESSDNSNYSWVMVDCECGVPPYVPINLKAFGYYIKQSISLRRLLFDDDDINRLRKYISEKERLLMERLGNTRYCALLENINQLEKYQNRWKSKTRVQRGITYQLKKGKLSQKWADFYSNHPLMWYGRETASGLWRAYTKLLGDLSWRLWVKITQINPIKSVFSAIKFIFSEKYRAEIGRNYAKEMIAGWKEKGRLDEQQASILEKQLESNELMDYMGDLGAHAMIWPIGKGLDVITVPYLYITGHPYLASFLAGWGTTPFLRIAYTGVRFAQSCINRKEKPWWALIGIFPQVGNLAYPIQMIISAEKGNKELPMFLIVGESTKRGEKLPILGGLDTLTEYRFNHLGYRIGKYFGRKK